MKNKKKIAIITLGVAIFLITTIALQGNEERSFPTIAACPTFHYMLDKIENSGEGATIKTQSTAESLNLLEKGMVDMAISGRALKLAEPDLLFEKIGPGYDFIFSNEILISEKEMQSVSFYTDVSLIEIINDFAFISERNLTKAENVYEMLSEGVGITRLENEMKGETVHIFQENGERLRLSRMPRLYYLPNTEEESLRFVKKIIKED